MISDTKIIEIFCNLDDFMKEFDTVLTKHSISDVSLPKKRNLGFNVLTQQSVLVF